jgi:hypothetical protein
MVNKPKQIGTKAETAVLRQITPYFPEASRNALAGHQDLGDIGHCGDFIFEVKGGKQTNQVGDALLAEWMDQATKEALHSGVKYGVLVLQRAGVGGPNARRWWVHIGLADLAEIMGGFYLPGRFATARMELGDFLDLIADQGFVPGQEAPSTTLVEMDTTSVELDIPNPNDLLFGEEKAITVGELVSFETFMQSTPSAAEPKHRREGVLGG